MTAESLAYVAVGGGAIASARWVSDRMLAKFDAMVERRAKALYGPQNSHVTPALIGQAVLTEFQPVLGEMVKIDAQVFTRVMAMEKAIATLSAEIKRVVYVPVVTPVPAAAAAPASPVSSPTPPLPSPTPPLPSPITRTSSAAPAPEPPAWCWKTDKAIRAVATDVVASLMTLGQKKEDAHSSVTRALDRVGFEGMAHDELFTESLKK